MFRDFRRKLDFGALDVTQISMVAEISPEEMSRIGYKNKTGLVFYGAGDNAQMLGTASSILKKLAKRGLNLIALPGKSEYFINPDAISFLRQARSDERDRLCEVVLGLRAVRREIKTRMTPDDVAMLRQALENTGKTFFTREIKKFREAPTIPMSMEIDGKIVNLVGKEVEYPWEFPAQLLMIDPAQVGLIRSDEWRLLVAFNDCAALNLDKGQTHEVPGLKESFAAMNPDVSAHHIHQMVQNFYKEKSLKDLRGLGNDLAKMTPSLTCIPGSLHLVAVRPSEVESIERDDKQPRLWFDFREAMHNCTSSMGGHGLWLEFRNDADRDVAVSLLTPPLP